MAYEGYNAYLSINSGSPKERTINHTKQVLSNNFKDSPSYYSVSISGITTDVHITDGSDIKEQKVLLTQSTSPLSTGDLVLWNSENWLTLIVDNMGSGIYYRGTIRKCVSSLKWKNSSGVAKEAYFTFNVQSTANFGVEEGRVINLGNERRQIIIQSNADTQLIKKDQRFIFDGRAWKVIAKDGLIAGLIYLTLEEDTTNTAKDDVINRVANSSDGGSNTQTEITNPMF
jgi:hypothetical protein